MAYSRLERRLAALLDSSPRLRAFARGAYQRASYWLRGGPGPAISLRPQVTIERAAGPRDGGAPAGNGTECFVGYFGLQPWSADGRFLFHRRNGARDATVAIVARDPVSGAEQEIGSSRTWNFQQGAMAQWLRLDGDEHAIFNDIVDGRLVCRIVAPDGSERRHPWPIQALHPRGDEALSLNYRRLARLRPEYGYDLPAENFSPDQPAERDGLWRFSLRTGEAALVVSLQALERSDPRPEMQGAGHKVNHAVYSPSGARFVFMHRWIGDSGKFSRLYVANADGSGLRLLLDHRMVSHYAWRDERQLLVWARAPEAGDRYYLLDVDTGARTACCPGTLDRFGDGHPSYSPDGRWLVTDTYPDRRRLRRLLLCRTDDGRMVEAGAFLSPWRYDGEDRCDLHPRWSPDGKRVSIDSSHEGRRWTYVLDVSRLVGAG